MARRTAVRPALMAAPWSSPGLLDSCHPSGQGCRVKAREATACGLALTRRTRPRQSSSEEDARWLHSLRPEARMPDVASLKSGRSAVRPCPWPPVLDKSLVLWSAQMPIRRFRTRNRRVTMTIRAWPWSAARYRTRIARRAYVPPDRGLIGSPRRLHIVSTPSPSVPGRTAYRALLDARDIRTGIGRAACESIDGIWGYRAARTHSSGGDRRPHRGCRQAQAGARADPDPTWPAWD